MNALHVYGEFLKICCNDNIAFKVLICINLCLLDFICSEYSKILQVYYTII